MELGLHHNCSIDKEIVDVVIDALAYIDQLAKVSYAFDYEEEDYEFLDKYAGY